MKRNILFLLVFIICLILMSNACGYSADAKTSVLKGNTAVDTIATPASAGIGEAGTLTITADSTKKEDDSLVDVELNGCKQKILVQADDLSKPILLYIHGGPGDPAMMYSYLYSDSLRKNFIFVNWDQRGSGLSWHEGMDTSKISEDQILDDALELTRYMIKSYNKDKIYILGHSFGSMIGLKLAYRHPELYHAYIGMGQVLDWNRSVTYTKKWLKSKMNEAGDSKGLMRLENESIPPMDMVMKYGGHTHTAVDFNSIMKASPYYFEGYIEMKNNARDLVQNFFARNGSSDDLSLMDINELKIPLYFFEGRYDHVTACAPELVLEFYNKLKAPDKEIIWFENSAHLPNLEEPEMFQQMLIEKLLNRQKK